MSQGSISTEEVLPSSSNVALCCICVCLVRMDRGLYRTIIGGTGISIGGSQRCITPLNHNLGCIYQWKSIKCIQE